MSGLNNDINIQDAFSECRNEMGLQQAKRDQIIAFYLTLCGIVCSVAFLNEFDNTYRHFILLPLALIGFLLTSVVLRYRLYKETYWLSSKVILSLYSVDVSKITEEKVKESLYAIMRRDYKDIIDKYSGDVPKSALFFHIVRKQSISAEMLMYSLMSFLSSGCLGVCIGIWLQGLDLAIMLSASIGLALVSYLSYIFVYDYLLTQHYHYILTANENTKTSAINKAYSKAWMLHFFE